jgi:hypothetical protein
MEIKPTSIALMAILAIGSGVAGFSFASNNIENSVVDATTFVVKPTLTGHLTLEARDADGNLKAYRESDNVITQTGENCALRLLFTQAASHTSTGNTVCTGALTNPFTYIAVGSGTTQEDGAQVALVTEIAANGLSRDQATTVTWTNSTGSEGTPGQAAVLTLSKVFTVTGSSTVAEAGLFNDTSANQNTDGMFARKVFDAVSVQNGDSLTVTWTISVGNTTSSVGS